MNYGEVDKYRLNRYIKRENIRNESIFNTKTEKGKQIEKLRNKISSLPKITQKLLLKDQQKNHNWNIAANKIHPKNK